MSCLVFGYDQELAEWAARNIPYMRGLSFGPCAAIGVMAGDDPGDASAKIQAVAVFHDYIPAMKTCQVSVASRTPMWARHGIIRALLSYPFDQLGVNLVWSAMLQTNERAIRFNEHIGFKRDSVLRHRYGWKRHAVVSSMTKYEYERTWKNGKVLPVSAVSA